MRTLVQRLSDAMLELFVPKVTVRAAVPAGEEPCGYCHAGLCLWAYKYCSPAGCGPCNIFHGNCSDC